jgi:hypothetical protein
MKKARDEGDLSDQEYDEIEEKLKRSNKSQNTNLDNQLAASVSHHLLKFLALCSQIQLYRYLFTHEVLIGIYRTPHFLSDLL